jgi:CheY-like chemotaxis protein
MLARILCVDDEPNVLQAFERQFRKQFQIQTALGPEIGLKTVIEQGPFAVVVSDLRMPGMNGNEFLARVRQIAPNTVRIMLTGQADLSDAITAVNQGNVFQFLTKPCPSEMLARALNGAVEQHNLITAEKELLEQTLLGTIGVLSEILSLVNPSAFSCAQRIRSYARHIAHKLELPNPWQYELAAMLSQIGCIGVPPEIIQKKYQAQPLEPSEQEAFSAHPKVGQDLLAKIPRLQNVAGMVARQNADWQSFRTDAPSLGGNLIRIALEFDRQTLSGVAAEDVLAWMRSRKQYNQTFVDALAEVQIGQEKAVARLVKLAQLKTGMVVNSDVRTKTGLLLIAKGQEVTQSAVACVNRFANTVGIVEPISVLGPDPSSFEAPNLESLASFLPTAV